MLVDTGEKTADIDFAPKTTAEEVIQNIRTLLSTFKGQVPLDRGFGLSVSVMDLPVRRAMSKLQIEILESIQDYEPRAIVRSINFKTDRVSEGILIPVVEVDIDEQE